MGRRPKEGLDYFPKDVGYYDDFKIMDLINEYGPLGQTIYDIIVTEIYRAGYYLEVDIEKMAMKTIRIIGNRWVKDKNLVLQVIQYCADIGLLHKDLLRQSVITSVGVQRRYSEVTVRNKVKKDNYWLLDENGKLLLNVSKNTISVTGKAISVTEIDIDVSEMPTKESKEKESKEKNKSTIVEGSEKLIILLPLKSGEDYPVQKETLDYFKEIYPTVDILQELKKMQAWLYSNADKGKTKTGIKRFINNWLSKSSAPVQVVVKEEKPKTKNKFNNFNQRTYDYAELEKQLLDVNKEQEAKN